MQTSTKPRIDLQQLYQEIKFTADLAETPCNPVAFEPVIEAYRNQYEGGVASLRTNTRPVGKRELDVRYINVTQPHDPYQIALDNGFLTEVGHPMESLMREIQTDCPVLGYGVDTSVSRGFTKIWTLFKEPVPVEELLGLRSMPSAAHQYTDLFAKYDLKGFGLVAIDFIRRALNVYFLFRNPEDNHPTLAGDLMGELGFNRPSMEEQALFSKCGDVHFTFTWDAPTCERLSFVVLHAPVSQFPQHLDPLFPRLVDKFPTIREQRIASIQSSYSLLHGNFLKIEMDYSGMGLAMRGAMDAVGQ